MIWLELPCKLSSLMSTSYCPLTHSSVISLEHQKKTPFLENSASVSSLWIEQKLFSHLKFHFPRKSSFQHIKSQTSVPENSCPLRCIGYFLVHAFLLVNCLLICVLFLSLQCQFPYVIILTTLNSSKPRKVPSTLQALCRHVSQTK